MSIETLTKTAVILGHGDVLIGTAVHRNGTGSLCFAAAQDARKPGTPAPEMDGKFGIEDMDLSINFASLESIESMIARLTDMRGRMEKAGAQ